MIYRFNKNKFTSYPQRVFNRDIEKRIRDNNLDRSLVRCAWRKKFFD